MLRNGNFTEGWETLPPLREAGNLKNQRPNHWQLTWLNVGDPLYADPNSRVTGIPECVHKLSTQLPADEQPGGARALILAGKTTYKIFSSGAVFGAALAQTVTGLRPGSRAVLTVPIQAHLHGETDDYGAESGVWVNGEGSWVNGRVMCDRQWYRHTVEFIVPGNGTADIVIRVKSKWPKPKDFFMDAVSLEAEMAETETTNSEPDPEPELTREADDLANSSDEKKVKYVTAEAGLWLRSGPSTEDDTLVRMMPGTAVEVLEEKVDSEGNWDFVRLGEMTGYAYRAYLATGQTETPRKPDNVKLGRTPTTTRLASGMNINPDAPHSNPLHEGVLRGFDWVRFPFKAADKHRSVTAAFSEYDPIIQGYASQGVGSLVVLNQQTVAGNEAPWPQKNWAGLVHQYAAKFAAAAGEIATHYAHLGDKVAYQIWNEGDNPETPWVSVHVPPEHFAVILSRAAQAIRAASPASPIVFGGLSTGPDQAAAYVRACQQALGGQLPVDAIGLHPYGRWPVARPFPDWTFGRLDDAFAVFKRTIPDKPLWITEIGIPGHANPIGEQHYPTIANYMREVYTTIASNHADHVSVVFWFAWSDNMENAGIVTADGNRKAHIFNAFTAVRDRQII
ncbi:MAG: SH3 domain-containing protein [Anaerolineaceae bacterium]|nr:SH3 domain-containing protein [Anaerolineaceae bacterium]